MKRNLKKILLLIIVATNFTTSAEQTEDHQHKQDPSQLEIVLDHGEKWAIDDSLHLGMTAIKQEITTNLDLIHNNHFSQLQYAQLAVQLDKHLTYLFKNCQLPPQADAQLHILLAQIAGGVGIIKQEGNKKQGAVQVIKALIDYPKYFNDPAWQGLQH